MDSHLSPIDRRGVTWLLRCGSWLWVACCLLAAGLHLRADVKLPKIISNHMVLQRSPATSIWGWAAPGESVTVSFDSKTAQATADADGKWKAALDLSKSGQGPFDLTVEGKNKITVSDVLVGQVWVASGQSNMELPLQGTLGSAEEIAQATNPFLRQYFVVHNEKPQPPAEDSVGGSWRLTDPTSAASPSFSAVAYYFGKELQGHLKAPVGIVQSTVGGTAIEQWMSSEGFDPDPELKAAKNLSLESITTFTTQRKAYPGLFNAWLDQHNRQDKTATPAADFAGVDVATTDWTPLTLPGSVMGGNLPPRRRLLAAQGDQSHRGPNPAAEWKGAGCHLFRGAE